MSYATLFSSLPSEEIAISAGLAFRRNHDASVLINSIARTINVGNDFVCFFEYEVQADIPSIQVAAMKGDSTAALALSRL